MQVRLKGKWFMSTGYDVGTVVAINKNRSYPGATFVNTKDIQAIRIGKTVFVRKNLCSRGTPKRLPKGGFPKG